MKRILSLIALTLFGLLLCIFPSSVIAGDQIKIATWDDVNSFDPAWMSSAERELTIMSCLYNGLVKYKEGSWEIVPDLAESWEVAPDGKSMTFKLRKGVQFHNGYGEMTAEDVKFSFERIIDPAAECPEKGQWKLLDRVEVVDAYTVRIVLKDIMPTLFDSVLPMNSGYIVSKKAVEKLGREKFGFNPVGTGPYMLKSWEPKKRVTLTTFSGYWGDKPQSQTVEFIPIVEDATCETALKTGEIDVGRASSINIAAFKKNKKFSVVSNPAMKTYWLGMTVNKAPFDNLKLREAFRYAVDVDKIVEAAFFGTAERANSILPPGVPGYWKDAPIYRRDIKKAKSLIKEAGMPNGFQAKLYVPAQDIERIMAEVIKADAQEAGIDVVIEAKEIGAFNEAANKGETDAYIQFYTATLDPYYIMQYFAGPDWNPSQWRNTTYAELMNTAVSEIDQAKRINKYIDAQKQIDKDCWAIWLTHGTMTWVAKASFDLGAVYPNGRLAPWTMTAK